jgi:hypothetical protein
MKLSYLKALAERAGKTFAQTLVAALTAGATDLLSVGWVQALSVAGGITRVLALPRVNEWLTDHLGGKLAAIPRKKLP